jgi:hypothetical protein
MLLQFLPKKVVRMVDLHIYPDRIVIWHLIAFPIAIEVRLEIGFW